MKNHPIVTLSGSTKFKDNFLKAERELTLRGNIVLSVGFFSHTEGIVLTNEQIANLDELHKAKIDMSDELFVINKDGYIGQSTASEIEYALSLGKKVRYMYVQCDQDCIYASCCTDKNPHLVPCIYPKAGGSIPICEQYVEENK